MLATWIQFEDHWSTTLLTGTVSAATTVGVYQIHAAPSRNCWRQIRVQQSKESLSSAVLAPTPFVTSFLSNTLIGNWGASLQIYIYICTFIYIYDI